jgi:hypothetical protein
MWNTKLRGCSESFWNFDTELRSAARDWLEIEAGISALFGNGQTEWGAEFVVAENTASIGGVAVLDFQFWPLPDRKFGWFVEPSYGLDFGKGHQQSLGVTAGLLIAIR